MNVMIAHEYLLIFPQVVPGDIDWCLLRLNDTQFLERLKIFFPASPWGVSERHILLLFLLLVVAGAVKHCSGRVG